MAKKRIQKLLVVFDTSVLVTEVASELVRKDVRRIVEENANHPDLEISWHLPQVVIGERRYQMLAKAKELLPNLQKLERLLGHKFSVGEGTLELHVDKAIKSAMDELGFQTASIKTVDVDWDDIISRSVTRDPPFDRNGKEKGFRDSIIAQSFIRLHKSSPATPSICLLSFVSDDKRLREYVTELTADARNVRTLTNLSELESLINTLVSTVTEEFAAELAQKASKMFFEKGNDKTFYYREKLGDKIHEQYGNELSDTIIPGRQRSGKMWWIFEPIFLRKERQRIYWSSTVESEFEIFHYEQDESPRSAPLGLPNVLGSQISSKGKELNTLGLPAQKGLGFDFLASAMASRKIVDSTGREKFEVHWSTNLTKAHNLTSPKLEKIEHLGNNLAEAGP